MNCPGTDINPARLPAGARLAPIRAAALLCLALGLALALFMAPAALAQNAEAVYSRAKADYKWLVGNQKAMAVQHNWQSLAERFGRIYTRDPYGPLAPGCLLWMGRTYSGAYEQFKQVSYLQQSEDFLKRLINHFPKSKLADDAQMLIAELYRKAGDNKRAYLEYLKVTVNYPSGDQVRAAKRQLDSLERTLAARAPADQDPQMEAEKGDAALGGDTPTSAEAAAARRAMDDPTLAQVTELRHWSTPTYTRVVVNLERPVPYNAHLLKKDREADLPRRLYLDLRGARVGPGFKDTHPIDGGLLKQARAGQFNQETVRLVLDIAELGSYKIFTLDNPFRLVVDCFATSPQEQEKERKRSTLLANKPVSAKGKRRVPRGEAKDLPPEVGLAQALGLGIKRIVIDPGHGGKDPGCHHGGLYEKDITLDVARRLAAEIKGKLGCQVILTRNSDKYLTLEERTALANTKDADLFISIHVNAAPGQKLNGIETYFLNLASDEQSMLVAARENATTTRTIGDLQVILNDLMLNSKIDESNRLARTLHGKLVYSLRQNYKVTDLNVRQAPFYVLIGAQMPSVLVEVGFISNPTERQRLQSAAYRDHVAQGIAKGVMEYARNLKMAGIPLASSR